MKNSDKIIYLLTKYADQITELDFGNQKRPFSIKLENGTQFSSEADDEDRINIIKHINGTDDSTTLKITTLSSEFHLVHNQPDLAVSVNGTPVPTASEYKAPHHPNPHSFHTPKAKDYSEEQKIQEQIKLIDDTFDAKLLNRETLPKLKWKINRSVEKGICLVLENFNIPEIGKDKWLARFQEKFPNFELSVQTFAGKNKLVFNNILHNPEAMLAFKS
jgi:hypothetical protein